MGYNASYSLSKYSEKLVISFIRSSSFIICLGTKVIGGSFCSFVGSSLGSSSS